MPLYDYQCQACGARVEVMHKIAESAPPCPACGAEALKKQLSAPNFRLAGAGWYETDFKDKAQQDSRKLAGGADGDKDKAEGAKDAAAPAPAGGEAGAASGGDKAGAGAAKTEAAGARPSAPSPSAPAAAPAAKPASPSAPSVSPKT